MPELTQLHELTGQVRPPDLQQLSDVAAGRRRRSAAAIATGVTAATAVAVALGAGVTGQRSTDTTPVTPPKPTPTRTFAPLTAEQIRNHSTAEVLGGGDFPATASTTRVRLWTACLDDCSRDTEWLPGEQQQAVEVTRDDFEHSALYALGGESISHAVGDWYLIDARGGPTLVNSRGETRPVRNGAKVAVTEIAGPPVYANGLGYVDVRTATLHDLEQDYWDWQGAGDSWYWGTLSLVPNSTVKQQAVLWQNPDGGFEVRVLPIGPSDGTSGTLRAGAPGTMAVVEHFALPRVAHISTDYGHTWQLRLVPDDVESEDDLPADWTTWAPAR